MSGYLELKYPQSQLGLNPFKSWKRQWCIIRPCPKRAGGVSLAVYSSEAGHSAGCIEIPRGSKITKAKSRSRASAFAIYTPDEPQRPRILLASHSAQDSQIWIDKINCMLNSETQIDTNLILMESYFISILSTDLAKKCGFHDIDAALSLTAHGLMFAEQAPKAHKITVPWHNVIDVVYSGVLNAEKNKICSVTVDSGFAKGSGVLKFTTPSAPELTKVLRQTLRQLKKRDSMKQFSKSDSDLQRSGRVEESIGNVMRDSFSSETSSNSVSKEDSKQVLVSGYDTGYCSDYQSAQDVVKGSFLPRTLQSVVSVQKSSRRSLISIASGIYEEIPDEPYQAIDLSTDGASTEFQHEPTDGATVPLKENNRNRFNRSEDNLLNDSTKFLEEPMYESVSDSVFATMRRSGKRFPPPPLPPRVPLSIPKQTGWKAETSTEDVTHASLGSLPQSSSVTSSNSDLKTKTLPKYDKSKGTFNVFRKRLKSDSIIHSSTKTKDKDLEHKKKRFEFTPKKDIFKGFRKNKGGKNTNLTGESKSCENLEEPSHETCNRCSKSVESLDNYFEDDLSIDYSSDVPASLSLPPDIVEWCLKSQERSVGVKCEVLGEDDYMPMSPAATVEQTEQHYIVMSPRSDLPST